MASQLINSVSFQCGPMLDDESVSLMVAFNQPLPFALRTTSDTSRSGIDFDVCLPCFSGVTRLEFSAR